MNNIYRKVWSPKHGAYVVASESARGRGKVGRCLTVAALSAIAIGGAHAQTLGASALPSGAQVAAGAASVRQAGANLVVEQNSQRAAINWQSFSVGRDAKVIFNQPNAGATALNRVVGNERSVIDGSISANGNVWLLNSAGVLFNQGSRVDVGGLVASTLAISDADFMAGRSTFESNGSLARVINRGAIRTAQGGYVALLGQQVANEGLITATMGSAMLAAGDKVSLRFDGNSLIGVTVDKGSLDALVENKHAIYADGGRIHLTTQALDEVLNGVVNNSGVIEAKSIGKGQNGEVILFAHGGTVNVGGSIKADLGFVETSGKNFLIQPAASVAAGKWLIDPVNITVDATLAASIGTALASGDVTLQTTAACIGVTCSGVSGSGDIVVNSAITKSSGALSKLTLAADRDISVNAPISGSSGSPLDVVLASRYNGASFGGVYIGANIKTYGGHLTIGGGDMSASGFAHLHSSTPYGDNKAAVFVDQAILDATGDGSGAANTMLPTAAAGGDITIRGKGDPSVGHQFNAGVYFYQNKTIGVVTGGNGSISIEGWGGKANAHFWDVAAVGVLWESKSTYIKAKGGDISITGYKGSVADQYGIVSEDTFIGTDGYLKIAGDSHVLRGGVISLNVGTGGGDITAPLIGIGGSYTLNKTGSGVLNIAADAQAWNTSRPSNTTASKTIGTFTDATNSVNLVNLSRGQALYAFNTVPSTVNVVTQSQATPLSGSSTTSVTYSFPAAASVPTYSGNPYSLSSIWSSASLFGNTYSAWVPGTDYTFQYNGNTVTSFTNAGTYSGLTVNVLKSGFSAAASGNTNGSFTIAPKTIGLNAAKTYDGNVSLGSSQVSITGLVGNETLAVSGITANSKNVGAGNYISAIVLGNGSNGGLASNYQLPVLNVANAPVSISAKPLTISGVSVADKAYDGTSAVSLNGGALQGVVSGDVVTFIPTANFADKNTGSSKPVTAAITLAGANASNYSITQPTGLIGSITPRQLTINGTRVVDKAQDGTASANVILGSLQGVPAGEQVSVLSAIGSFSDSSVGVGKRVRLVYTLSNPNYSLADETLSGNVTIAYGSGLERVQSTVQSASSNPQPILPVVMAKEAIPRSAGSDLRAAPNVIALPPRVEASLGSSTNLLLISTPRAQESAALVSLSEAKAMLAPSATGPSSSGTTTMPSQSDVRIPVSRNSLADIVNGGVNLPEGVEQQMFVVKN